MLLCQNHFTNIRNFSIRTKHFFIFFTRWKQFLFCLVSSCLNHRTNITNFEHIAKHFFYLVETFFLFPLSFRLIVSKNFSNISNFEHITKHFFTWWKLCCFLLPSSCCQNHRTNIGNFKVRSKHYAIFFYPMGMRGALPWEDTKFTPNFQALYFDHPKNSACLCGGNCVYLYCN
jgi:hypothetical protein